MPHPAENEPDVIPENAPNIDLEEKVELTRCLE